jgi:hypothetical protein
LNLIAIFRIKTYEDLETNVPLIGISIDVFHFIEKKKYLGLWEIGIHISPKPSLVILRLLFYLRRGGNSWGFLMLKNVRAAYQGEHAKGV